MRDTIYRDDAIRIASGFCHPANVAKELGKLPSAEPQIIRCKDCKYHNYWRECRKINGLTDAHKTLCTDDSFYCGFAERMEVTE